MPDFFKVIQGAERQFAQTNLRVAGLSEVIKNFKKLKASGQPWPVKS